MRTIKKDYIVIRNIEELSLFLNYIKDKEYMAFDSETTGLNVRKDTVIGYSVCAEVGKAYYIPRFTWNGSKLIQVIPDKEFINSLNNLKGKELLMFNGSFDIRVIRNNLGVNFINELLADVMLMKHTVEEEPPFKLKDIAVQIQEYLGLDVEHEANIEQLELKQNIKKNGGSITKTNFEMYKADLDVMGKYACADADLTLRVAEYYSKKLEEEDLENFFYDEEVMPLYKEVTIPMEDRGVRLNIPLIEKTKNDIIKDMSKIENKILKSIKAMPEYLSWEKKKAIKLYPAKKSGNFAKILCKEFKIKEVFNEKTKKYSFAKKLVESIDDSCSFKDFLLGKSELEKSISEKISLIMFRENEQFSIGSKKQLSEIIFDEMGIKPLSTTDKGNPQFNDDTIQHLLNNFSDIPWIKDLSDYNKLVKIKGTYIDQYLKTNENGIFYPYFKQHGTVSGRYSSNIQQLPRVKEEGELSPVVLKYSNILRSFFIAREKSKLIICDQSSLEPRVFASVSNDPKLINVFLLDEDLYSKIGISAFKIEGCSAKKTDFNYLKIVYPEIRQKSKEITLAVPYGAGEFQISKSLGISKPEAKKLIKDYLDAFPDLSKWIKTSREEVVHFGIIKTKLGRIRHLPKVKKLHKIHGSRLLDWKYRKRLENSITKKEVKSLYLDYKNGLNTSTNSQIQGLSASIMNRSGIQIARKFKENNIKGHIIMQIHDEYVLDVLEKDVEKACEIVRDCMENTVKIETGLVAKPSIADHFGEGHD